MPLTGTVKDRNMTLKISGEVDHHQAKRLMEELNRRIDIAMPRRLELDLSAVTFMDSSGIALLLRAWRRMRELEGTVHITGVPDQAARVLRAAGLERIMEIH